MVYVIIVFNGNDHYENVTKEVVLKTNAIYITSTTTSSNNINDKNKNYDEDRNIDANN